MDNNVNKLLESFKIPHFYRDLMILIGGMGFVVLFCYFHPNFIKDIISKFDITNFTLESDFVVLVASYIIGRLLLLLSDIIFGVYYFIMRCFLKIIYYKSLSAIYQDYKLRWSLFIASSNIDTSFSSRQLENTLTAAEIGEIRERLPALSDNIERENLNAMFLRMLTATLFLSLIFFNWDWKLIIAFLISFVFFTKSHNKLNLFQYQLSEAAAKEVHNNKQQKLNL